MYCSHPRTDGRSVSRFRCCTQIAKQAGFTQESFEKCMGDQKLYNDILAMRERGSKDYKVESTPTLFVNGKVQKGGATIEQLDKLIETLLPKS